MTCMPDMLCLLVDIRILVLALLKADLVNHLGVLPLLPLNMDIGHSPNNKSSKEGTTAGDEGLIFRMMIVYAPLPLLLYSFDHLVSSSSVFYPFSPCMLVIGPDQVCVVCK